MTATAHLALPAIAPGVWFGAPALVGPFGNGDTLAAFRYGYRIQ